MYELLAVAIGAGFLLLCMYFTFGSGKSSGGVSITRPKENTVDGFGASRGADFSYGGTSPFSMQAALPVGLREDNKGTGIIKDYAHDVDNDW